MGFHLSPAHKPLAYGQTQTFKIGFIWPSRVKKIISCQHLSIMRAHIKKKNVTQASLRKVGYSQYRVHTLEKPLSLGMESRLCSLEGPYCPNLPESLLGQYHSFISPSCLCRQLTLWPITYAMKSRLFIVAFQAFHNTVPTETCQA